MATFLDALNSQQYIGFFDKKNTLDNTEHYQGASYVMDSEITPIGMYHAPKLPGQDYQYPSISNKMYPNSFITQQKQLDSRFTPTSRARSAPRVKPEVHLAATPQPPLPYIRGGKKVYVDKKK